LEDPRRKLALPDEPAKLRAETRAFVEDSPEEGLRLVNDARFLANSLWGEWGTELEEAGLTYERFLQITRGYTGEIWLWVMGERTWDHCVAGLAGRFLRRLPEKRRQQEPVLASCAECR